MSELNDAGIGEIYHFTPLHYLPFIARSNLLLSKPSLASAGFGPAHLRSMSHKHDVARGFGAYTHLTLSDHPRILKAKLSAGFPHIGISVPATAIKSEQFSLCRFNVAMTRRLRRNGRAGFPASPTNGRYYPNHQIPLARESKDKAAMLQKYKGTDTVIEVLVHGNLSLPKGVKVVTFADKDTEVAKYILGKLNSEWSQARGKSPGPYPDKPHYRKSVADFIEKTLADPTWRGNGLEFDRV